jgi:F-type H+-transporting ATPase subunit b
LKKSAIAFTIGLLLLAAAPAVFAQHASQTHGSGAAQSRGEDSGQHGDSGIWWKWANFAILAGGLGYLIAKKAPAFFESRTHAIQKDILEARAMREQAEAKAAEIQRRLDNLSSEVDGLRHAGREELAAEEARLRAETAESIRKIKARAEQELAAAVKTASQELKSHAADLAIELARQKIRSRMTAQIDDSLVRSFVTDLGLRGHGQTEGEVN